MRPDFTGRPAGTQLKLRPHMMEAPPEPRQDRFARRWLLVSGVMLVVLLLLNALLFWQVTKFDVLTGLILGLAVVCFLYQWQWRVMRIINWFLIFVTVPFWLLGVYLGYHMAAASWVKASEKPLPEEFRLPPPDPERLAAYEQFLIAFPAKSAEDKAIHQALQVIVRMEVPKGKATRTIEQALADPEVQAALVTATPYVENAYEFLLTNRPQKVPHVIDISQDKIRDIRQAREGMIKAALVQGRGEEARRLVLQELRLCQVGLEMDRSTIEQVMELGMISWTLRNLTSPALVVDQELLDELGRLQEAMAESRALLAPAVLQEMDQFFNLVQETVQNGAIDISDLYQKLPTLSGWLSKQDIPEQIPELAEPIDERLMCWPFSFKSWAAAPEPFQHLIRGEDKAAREVEQTSVGLWEVNPGGKAVYLFVTSSLDSTRNSHRKAAAQLTAYQIALSWRGRLENPQLGLETPNPATKTPYTIEISPLPDGSEKLFIGLEPLAWWPAPEKNPVLEQEGKLGKFAFGIVVTRPAPPPGRNSPEAARPDR
jgi:hypothetical protein